MTIKLKKNWLIISFSIVFFSLISISLATAGNFLANVSYSDNCPREGARVRVYHPVTGYVGYCITNEMGQCQKTMSLSPDTMYKANATWPGSTLFGSKTFATDSNGDGNATIINQSNYYPNGTETCGDTECDGYKYCYSGNPPYVECDSWNTNCDSKKCCQCNGGTIANPTENYDESQHEDCPFCKECYTLDTCRTINPITSCGCSLDKEGIYSLDQNIIASGDCLNIIADNVGLDCQGYNITGSGGGIGIKISSNGVVIINCKISHFNSGINIFLGATNLIYNNYFADNQYNAVDQSGSTSYWNTTNTTGPNIMGGPFIGGNYWDDYTGSDTDGDGIGNNDLPYTSNGNIWHGGDYLPLVDINSPTITIISPKNTTYYNTSIPLAFTINEPTSWCSYSLDGKANVTLAGCTNTTLTGLPNGLHNIIVYANDTFGNMGISNKVYFTVRLATGGGCGGPFPLLGCRLK